MKARILESKFAPESLAAGNYLAVSDKRAYSILRAMALNGMAELVRETYEPGGLKSVVVRVGGKTGVVPNAQKTMPMSRAFLVNVLKDYNDWQEKWWRECVQNSVDARAKNVYLDEKEQPDGTVVVSCTDDGHGMDVPTILGKFLVFGESTKPQVGGMAGGFGKAKEMLLLPWLWWKVESNGYMFEGVGNQYDDQPTRSSVERGTRLSVCMPVDMRTTAYHAVAFLEKCNIPGVKFFVNGAPTPASQRAGRMFRELDKATVHQNKSASIHGIFMRTHGIYMFSYWLSSDVPGAIFVEITAPSIEVLSSNRDGFRDEEFARQIHRIQNEIAVNVLSATEHKNKPYEERFRGSGMLDADAASSEVLANIPSLPAAKGGAIQVGRDASVEFAKITVTIVDEQQRRAERRGLVPEGGGWGGGAGKVDADIAALMVESVPILGQQHLENMTRQLVWTPDFFVMSSIEGYRVPKRFTPAGMAPMVLRLAKLWAELCRYVLIQLNCSSTFGVGFTFHESFAAQYSNYQGDNWLLLNPFVGSKDGPILSHAKDSDLRKIYAYAIHEATHMVNGVSDHNEIFSTAFTRNVAICADGFRIAKKIASLVGKRKVVGGDEEKPPKRAKSKLSKESRNHVKNFLETVAVCAAGYIADKRGEPSEYAWNNRDDWAIYTNALDTVHDLVKPDSPSWSGPWNAGLAAELLHKGYANLDPTTQLKVDVGNCAQCVVVMLRASDETEAAWQAMLDDFGTREFDVVPGYDHVTYTVWFEKW
jgi:hypothetical protein